MKPVLIIGSACVDVIIRVDRLPQTEEDTHILSQSLAVGGCAWNVSSVLRLLDIPHTLIAPVGTGIYGDYVARHMAGQGILPRVRVPDQENGCCYCFVDASGERTFLSLHGAEYTFRKEWMEPYPAEDYFAVYVCGLEVEEPTGEALVEYLKEHPALPVCYAPGPRGARIPRERTEQIFALHPLLHLNEREALKLSGKTDYRTAALALWERTGGSVIVTLGARGAFCVENTGHTFLAPAAPCGRIVDTIGAGDSHIGAVLSCLAAGLPLPEAVRYANLVSAAVLGVRGTALTRGQLPPFPKA